MTRIYPIRYRSLSCIIKDIMHTVMTFRASSFYFCFSSRLPAKQASSQATKNNPRMHTVMTFRASSFYFCFSSRLPAKQASSQATKNKSRGVGSYFEVGGGGDMVHPPRPPKLVIKPYGLSRKFDLSYGFGYLWGDRSSRSSDTREETVGLYWITNQFSGGSKGS